MTGAELHPTPDQLEQVFHAALKEGDARGVGAALRLMAVQDPGRAQRLADALDTALKIACEVTS
jgi:uridine phosphorylase